jgi:hypothetical protein
LLAANSIPVEVPGTGWLKARQIESRNEPSPSTDRLGRTANRRWTQADDDKLLDLAGYEPANKIAQRLDRSSRAVRFRMCALGMSAKASD